MKTLDEPMGDVPMGKALRHSVYSLLIVVGLGIVLGRILAVDAVDRSAVQDYQIKKAVNDRRAALKAEGLKGADLESALTDEQARLREKIRLRRPFLSGNDRSRWCTVRALVEPEMRVPGVPYAIDRVIQEEGWDTIDMVKHDDHLYSSKPPLMATLMAGEYWLIYNLAGKSLDDEPFAVGRFMLITINGGFLLLYFLGLARLVERLGTTDWGRIFVMAAAVFGTYLTTFAVVINNHLLAAASASLALDAAVKIWLGGRRWRDFLVAGFFAAFLAANELPALSLTAVLSLALLWKAPRQTLVAYVPAAAVVVVAFFGTNWIAHASLTPAYAHRTVGAPGENWYDYSYERKGRVIESYWRNPAGIDRGEPSIGRYALHALVGHHGIFLLTPVWLLSVAGTAVWLLRSRPIYPAFEQPPAVSIQESPRAMRELALAIAVVSLVCVGFYFLRPPIDRNYGGMSSAFRWVFWLAPLWLVAMLPAVDWAAGRRWARGLALVLLALSAASASYPLWNPWTSPWAMDFLSYLGWLS